MTTNHISNSYVLRIPAGSTARITPHPGGLKLVTEWRPGQVQAESAAQVQHTAEIDPRDERQAGIRSLERRIKRMEDRGDKTLYLESCKERLIALRTGEIDQSFGDLYVSGLARTGAVPGR